ncbi:MAG: polysaccharide biosynthesis protein [uncultured bacterium]|nr:MAG: polysaccharide biosynthesis protein [uncultured bacterium]
MSIKKILIKNTAFNLLGYFYLLFVSFFSISVMLKNLGTDLFGVYIFLSSFVPLASVFDFGVAVAAVRGLSFSENSEEKKLKIWQTSLFIFLFQAVILFFAVGGLLFYLYNSMPLFGLLNNEEIFPLFLLICLTVFVNHLNSHFLNLPQAKQRFDIFNSKTFLVGSANTIFTALLTYKTSSLISFFALQLFFHLLTFLYTAIYNYKFFPGINFLPRYDKTEGSEMLSFGLKNFIGILAGQMEAQISKFFLGFYSTAQQIASFNIPQSIVSKGAGIVSQFGQAFFPLSASLLKKEKILKLKKLFFNLQMIIGLGSIVGIVLTNLYGYQFLLWWLKDVNVVNTSFPVLKILIYYFLLVALTPIPTALVQGLNKPQIASFFAVLTITFEIITLFYFVPRYQAVGAAYSFLLSSLISVPAFIVTSWIVFEKEIKRLETRA